MGEGSAREREFEEFYRASYSGLVAHVYALTGDLTEAQEAAQETFVRAWRDWERITRYDHPQAWIRLVGRRIAVSRWRRAKTSVRSLVRHGVPDDVPGPGPESVALVGALRQLPEAQRRAVVLHHMGGLSIAEIAADEGVAEGTIKARLSRGRAALAGLLGEPADSGAATTAAAPAGTATNTATNATTATTATGRARTGVQRRG